MLCLSTVGLSTVGLSAFGVSAPSAAAARHAGLSRQQVHRIVTTTGYEGLRSHRLAVTNDFRASGVRTVVVRLDAARPAVALPALRRDLRLAARLAADRPAFRTALTLGSAPRQRVTFHVAPANVLTPHAPYLRYLIFTPRDERLASLTRPQQVPAIRALTVIDAAHRINVSLLQDTAAGATWGPGVPAARLFALVESLNTSSYLYVAPKTLERLNRHHVHTRTLAALGREIWSNSLGFAISAARHGTAYARYAHQVDRLRFAIYRHNDLRYLKVPARQYRTFAR